MEAIRQFFPYQNTKVYYELTPHEDRNAPCLVLVHGFLSSMFSFRRLEPLLTQSFHVLTLDLPPFGRSGKSKRFTYSYENYGAIVNALLKELNWTNVFGIGHSMGGQVLLNAACNQSHRFSGLVLLGCSGYLKPVRKLVLSTYVPFFSHYLKYILAKTGVKGNLYNVVYEKHSVTPEMIQGYAEPFKHPKIFPALVRFIRHREGDLSTECLNTISLPIQLLWGAHDKVVPLKTGKRLEQDLPQACLHVYEDAAHLLPEEKPADIYRQVDAFITEVSTRLFNQNTPVGGSD
ncbi:alpha/beta fold hydrolase [Aureibacillus halotolerans]|uniref:Pimeloyl-ACP methyl ester carboxylesterase n=1 Tax=Aureibacillus halotolerans TaxID=1508390 RepID=A0A4R6U769_9BACI|nr:alpha/beta hydrolase [Aureibacillus halotolerans]TDQ40405.1 pimeloyl-ACP methyl ester carboxylesterase [Aureibacillus halotolerans]